MVRLKGKNRGSRSDRTTMQQQLKPLLTIGILCGVPLVYLFAVVSRRSQYAPANGVRTYSQLKDQGVSLVRAVRVASPRNHYCVFGNASEATWTLSSGPPAYLFDESGHLVDFTGDVGDSTTFLYSYKVYTGVEVDLESLEAQFTTLEDTPEVDSIR